MSSDYWYDDTDPAVALLRSVRHFRQADQHMRRRMNADMDLNPTDTDALRHIIAAESVGEPLTARKLADALHISTAATAKLLNRLTLSGHVVRTTHPRDRRAVTVTATDATHSEVSDRLSAMHSRMLAVARAVPAEDRRPVIDFLESLAAAIDPEE